MVQHIHVLSFTIVYYIISSHSCYIVVTLLLNLNAIKSLTSDKIRAGILSFKTSDSVTSATILSPVTIVIGHKVIT